MAPSPLMVNFCMMISLAGFIYLGIFAVALAADASTLKPLGIEKHRTDTTVVFFISSFVYLGIFLYCMYWNHQRKKQLEQEKLNRESSSSVAYYRPSEDQPNLSDADILLAKNRTDPNFGKDGDASRTDNDNAIEISFSNKKDDDSQGQSNQINLGSTREDTENHDQKLSEDVRKNEKEDAAIESDFKPLEDTTNRQMDIPVIQDVTKQHSTESAENPEVDSHAKRREHLGLTIETKKRAAKAEIIQADSPKEEKPSFGLTIKLQRVASGSPGSDGSPPANAKRDNFRENLAVSTKSRFSPEKSEDQSQQVQQLTPLKFPEESKNPTTPLTSSPTRSPSGRKIKLEDFTMVGPIGRGAYGEVVLVKKKINGQLYAMKVIDKLFLKKEKKEQQVYVEKEVLQKLNHPSVVRLYYSFQDKAKLYFVFEYLSGGEFSDYLRIQKKLTTEAVRFYAAEIVLIIEYLHSNGIAHRDLKPENLMMDNEGHLKIIDFGTAKYINANKPTETIEKKKETEDPNVVIDPAFTREFEHRATFVGTPQYVSPEMLEYGDCAGSGDLWALGCIIYYMAAGKLPFTAATEAQLFQKISEGKVSWPEDMDEETVDLISKLLVKNPAERLGCGAPGSANDIETLKQHNFFTGIIFSDLLRCRPPLVEVHSPYRKKGKRNEEPVNEFPQSPTRILLKEHHPNELRTSMNSEFFPSPEKVEPVQSPDIQDKTRNSKSLSQPPREYEKILLSGHIAKRHPYFIFYQTRLMVLSDVAGELRLRYYNPSNNELRREFPLVSTTVAEVDGPNKFTIIAGKEKFNCKSLDHPPEKWVQLINACCRRSPKLRANMSATENDLLAHPNQK